MLGPRKTVGEWEKPKKVVGGSTEKVASGWESASVSRGTSRRPLSIIPSAPKPLPEGTITSTNRFSALSLSSPSSQHPKKSLPRTSTTGTGKHRVDESATATPTKLQKKNAAQAAAKKAAKEAEEKERLERLAKYRREQEK